MRKIRVSRQPFQFVLDGLFVALLVHVFLTGNIVPNALVELFHDQPQIVASAEPVSIPVQDPDSAPRNSEGEPLPETRNPFPDPNQANL